MSDLHERVAVLEEKMTRNDKDHQTIIAGQNRNEVKLDEALKWQRRVRWTIGIVSTILGAFFLFLYQYVPWLWDALPMHHHTH